MTESFISGFGMALGILVAIVVPITILFLLGMVSAYFRRRRWVKRKNARKD